LMLGIVAWSGASIVLATRDTRDYGHTRLCSIGQGVGKGHLSLTRTRPIVLPAAAADSSTPSSGAPLRFGAQVSGKCAAEIGNESA
jgi:hypothetical protein